MLHIVIKLSDLDKLPFVLIPEDKIKDLPATASEITYVTLAAKVAVLKNGRHIQISESSYYYE